MRLNLKREGIKMREITTTDLSKFGHCQREELEDVLRAWRLNGLPDDFENDQVVPIFNMESGKVFLTNSEYQVCMLDGIEANEGKLQSFYTCPYCGHAGFKAEMAHISQDDMCRDYMRHLGVIS